MKTPKTLLIFLGTSLILYAISMIVIRLSLTQGAYVFEEAKTEERDLREEQVRLRARIADRAEALKSQVSGYQDPEPNQLIALPKRGDIH